MCSSAQVQKDLTLIEFEKILQDLRVKKGWVVTLQYRGVWDLTIQNKQGKVFSQSGAGSLETLIRFWFVNHVPENW